MSGFLALSLVFNILAIGTGLFRYSRTHDQRILGIAMLPLLMATHQVFFLFCSWNAHEGLHRAGHHSLFQLPLLFAGGLAFLIMLRWHSFSSITLIDYDIEGSTNWHLIRPALAIGTFASLGIVLIAIYSYFHSRAAIRRSVAKENLALSKTVSELALSKLGSPTQAIERPFEAVWMKTEPTYVDTYFCIVGPDNKVRLHTRTPSLKGQDVAGFIIDPQTGLSVGDLLDQHRDWFGEHGDDYQNAQLVGYHYIPELDALAVVHVPVASVDARFRTAVVPWIGSMILIGGVLFPVTLGLLYVSARTASGQALAHLAAAEEHARGFRNIFEQAIVGVLLFEGVTGNIRRCNRRFAEFGGQSAEECVNQSWDSLWQDRTAVPTLQDLTPLVDGKVDRMIDTFPLVSPDGSEYWLRSIITRFETNADTTSLLMAILADVTDEIQGQKQLEVMRSIDLAILSAQSPGEIANAALAQLKTVIRFSRGSLLVFPEGQPNATRLAVQAEPSQPDGPDEPLPLSWFRWQDDLAKGQITDVSDLTRVEHPSRMEQWLLAHGIHSYIRIPLIDQGRLVGSLNLGSHQAGYFNAWHRELTRKVADSLAIALRQAALRDEVEAYARELEQRVAERTRELASANEDLEAYAHSVAHDLRAPLRGVFGFSQALREDYGNRLDETAIAYLENIQLAAEQMDQLIVDLLEYSKVGQGAIHGELVNLDDVVAQSIDQLVKASGDRPLELTIQPGLGQVVARRSLLLQVVSNLVGNATKFTAPGVTPHVTIRSEPFEDRLRLWVEDNGIGIAPECQDRIFRIFERLHGIETYQGTGIGLAIVRRAVEVLGGQFGVESEVGQGSRFWVEFPVGDAARR